ncbi:MAG: hypothetical protein IJW85_11840, partial [Clostridia bacterium]|nr:hypothetical protein [Clostridia bacterium]
PFHGTRPCTGYTSVNASIDLVSRDLRPPLFYLCKLGKFLAVQTSAEIDTHGRVGINQSATQGKSTDSAHKFCKRKFAPAKGAGFAKSMDTPETVDRGVCGKRWRFGALRGGASKKISKKS